MIHLLDTEILASIQHQLVGFPVLIMNLLVVYIHNISICQVPARYPQYTVLNDEGTGDEIVSFYDYIQNSIDSPVFAFFPAPNGLVDTFA